MNMDIYNKVHKVKCQVCGKTGLEKVTDLGMQPLCNDFLSLEEVNRPQIYFPLELYHCYDDDLIQLGYVIPTPDVFGNQYTYLTGTSKSLVDFYNKWAYWYGCPWNDTSKTFDCSAGMMMTNPPASFRECPLFADGNKYYD